MINSISYSLLRADEMYSMGMQFVTILDKMSIEDPQLTKLKGNISIQLSIYDQAHLKPSTKLLTLKVSDADTKRDDGFKAFVTYVAACTKRLKPEWKEDCALLKNLIDLHGRTLYSGSYTKQSSRMTKLFHDVDGSAELKAAITHIEADEWYAEMRAAASDFDMVYDNRNANLAAESSVKTEDAFISLRYAIQMLIKYVDVMDSMDLNPAFATITQELNGIIAPLMTQIRSRKTRSEKEKEEAV